MYVRCDESSLYSRINYVHSPDGELLCGEASGNNEWCATGFSAHVLYLCQRPGADTEETGRYDLAERLVVFENALKIVMNYQRYSNIFINWADICNLHRKTPVLVSLLYCWNDFLDFQPIIGRFYKMRVSRNLTFTTFLSPFINTVLSFSPTRWILSVAR